MRQRDDIKIDRTFPLHRKRQFQYEWAEKTIVGAMLAIIGFLAAYTLHDFSSTLKQIRGDVSSLQVSFAQLAQHVKDEDARK